jgi:hypothetical protein
LIFGFYDSGEVFSQRHVAEVRTGLGWVVHTVARAIIVSFAVAANAMARVWWRLGWVILTVALAIII